METAGPCLTREQQINFLTRLLTRKGESAVQELQKRIANDEGIVVRGIRFDGNILKTALETYAATPAESAAPSSAEPASAEPAGEPFERTVKVTGGNRVATLTKPSVLAKPTGGHVEVDMTVSVVSRVVSRKDGRVYLKLKDCEGWVSTRSRKDFAKVVLSLVGGQPGESLEGNASLSAMGDADDVAAALGGDVAPEPTRSAADVGSSATPKQGQDTAEQAAPAEKKPTAFRITGAAQVPIHPEPSIKRNVLGQTLKRGEVFTSDQTTKSKIDGRVYLHLADGRGWVCVTSRTDFGRPVVEQAYGEDIINAGSEERRKESGKVIVIKRKQPDAVPHLGNDAGVTVDPAAKMRIPRAKVMSDEPLVFRSDEELWPEALRPPRPLTPMQRIAMRRVFISFGERVKETLQDRDRAKVKAESFKRSCAAQTELHGYVAKLEKEAKKLEAEWQTWVEKVLAAKDIPKAGATATESEENLAGVTPVQVRGERWFCAVATSPKKDKLDAEAAEKPENIMGPLRATADEAGRDHCELKLKLLGKRDVEGVTAEGESPGKSSKRKRTSPPETGGA